MVRTTDLREAELLANRLERSGDHRGANIIRSLMRTYEGSRTTNKLLHRDNMALRQQLTGGDS